MRQSRKSFGPKCRKGSAEASCYMLGCEELSGTPRDGPSAQQFVGYILFEQHAFEHDAGKVYKHATAWQAMRLVNGANCQWSEYLATQFVL